MKKKIEIETFLDFQFVSNPRFSKDGTMAAFVVSQARRAENDYVSDLWMFEVAGEKVRRLTTRGDVRTYTWTEDNKILFQSRPQTSDPDKPTCYYEIDPKGGEAVEAFRLEKAVWSMEQLADGRFLILGIQDNREKTDNSDYEVIEETPFWFNGYGFIEGRRRALFLYDRGADRLQALTEPWSDVAYYDVRGSKIAYQAYPWQDWMRSPFEPQIRLYDLETGEDVCLLEKHRKANYRICFWKDGEILFTGTDLPVDGEGQASDFFVLDIATGTYKKLSRQGLGLGVNTVCSDARYGGGNTAYRAEDGWYFLVTLNEGASIAHVDFSGNVRFCVTGDGENDAVDSFDYWDGHFLASKMTPGSLAELYYDGRQVTHFNDGFAAQYDVRPAEYHAFSASDGFEVHGFCIKPAGFEPGGKYPAIVHVHGGPLGAFGTVYHHEMQMWANAGYMVLYCNPRGSDGRGEAFSNILGKWGTVDYQNLMDFTDEMLRIYPEIDPERMAICGGSYGGFMTNWVIGHTGRFAAACAQRSISFMSGFEYSSDIGLMCTKAEQGVTTEEDYEEMWNQSPLKYAPNCTTPTLFIQSDEDYRCYMTDAMAMFNALKMHGCPAKMCLFHGENHELSRSGRPQNRISRMREILNWFDRYLKEENL